MDRKIKLRINSIVNHINDAINDLDGVDLESFRKSTICQKAVSFSIVLIGEQMIKLQELLGDFYPNIPWKKARGMRNYIVHDYDKVDVEEVYKTVKEDLPLLKEAFLGIRSDLTKYSKKSLILI